MIARLKGTIEATGDGWAIVDVHGVGYLVACSSRTLSRLGAPGEAAALWVDTLVREDAIQLFGFVDTAERDWFRLLLGVQGVGGKVALALLSALSTDDLARAIAGGDRAGLTRAQGVGAKLAARLVTELKDRAALIAPLAIAGGMAPALAAGDDGPAGEAVSALLNLGYRQAEAAAAVARARARLGVEAATAALVRAGLRDLGQERAR